MRRQPRAPFATFIRVLRISRGFTARYTPLGRLLIAVLLVSALFALDPNQTTAIGLFAILGAALVCAMLETWRWRPPLTVERHLPQYAVHGAAVTYQLAIHNHGQREHGLEIQDYLHDHFPTREAYTELRALHPQRDNWFDRRVGFLSWLRVARHLSGGELNAVPLEYVAADAVTTLAMTFHPARRGAACCSLRGLHCDARIPAICGALRCYYCGPKNYWCCRGIIRCRLSRSRRQAAAPR